MVASTGLAVAAILLVAMTAAGWWTFRNERRGLREVREGSLRSTLVLLEESAARLLAAEELSGLRTVVANAARDEGLASCRVTLAGAGIVADSDVSRIGVQRLPERWGTLEATASEMSEAEGVLTLRTPVRIPGRGDAVLEVSAPLAGTSPASWRAQAGLGVIGAAGMVALLLVYRRMRARFRAIGAIGEALRALAGGETAEAALVISPTFGAEAEAWNRMLAERASERREALAARVREPGGPRADLSGELAQACDAMWQGLVLIDEHLRVRYANGAAAAFLGVKRDQLVDAEVAPALGDARLIDVVRDIAAGRIRRRETVEIQRGADRGGGILRFSVRPVRREDSAAAIILIEDVTQQRVADEARNSFVAHATHELRTPLTNIRLYVERALEEGEKDATVRASCLNVINRESRRLERIVGDMLSVSEIEAGSLKLRVNDVRVDAVFEELRDEFAAQAQEKKIKLTFALPPKWPLVQGDRDKIVLALHNLVGNAIKYTPEGGEVTVKVEEEGGRLVVDVTDTGIGIGEGETELIFEKFYRAKDERLAGITGSGLGLTLAREVVRLHGGDIAVRSQLNKGSTFTVTLPVTAQAA